ncbi:MAG: hypothetical protein HY303_15110 [Candidatus Wallbacteria bacterium]|nr:hypothetical protein [Candidatus Wallbacteria bacterium]
MTYSTWKSAYEKHVASAGAKAEARLWNLENETRIDGECERFKDRLGELFVEESHKGLAETEASAAALERAVQELRPGRHPSLGRLESADRTAIPASVETYLDTNEIGWRYPTAFFRGRSVELPGPLKCLSSPGNWVRHRRFMWITFETGGTRVSRESPTAIKRELGLPHFKQGARIYRFELSLPPNRKRFIPTCLDAELYEAWQRPPKGSASHWGLTRDLTDGQTRWPELVVETDDYLGDTSPVGRLVSPASHEEAIQNVAEDYMIGRAP